MRPVDYGEVVLKAYEAFRLRDRLPGDGLICFQAGFYEGVKAASPKLSQHTVLYPCGCKATGPTPLPDYCGVHCSSDFRTRGKEMGDAINAEARVTARRAATMGWGHFIDCPSTAALSAHVCGCYRRHINQVEGLL